MPDNLLALLEFDPLYQLLFFLSLPEIYIYVYASPPQRMEVDDQQSQPKKEKGYREIKKINRVALTETERFSTT